MTDVQKHSVHTLVFRSLKRTHDMFVTSQRVVPPVDEKSIRILSDVKARDIYGAKVVEEVRRKQVKLAAERSVKQEEEARNSAVLVPVENVPPPIIPSEPSTQLQSFAGNANTQMVPRRPAAMPKPKWHAPWKLFRVISGHLGWVRSVTVEPGNEWFATGSGDRIIKIWELASGKLKVSLTGHVSTVRGLAVSERHPYLFSCGEDRQVKCWDLEYNKVVRHYHGHLSAVYSMALHPALDVLVTAGRDSTARVWDMRTKANIHTLAGHTNTVASVICQAAEPQIITGSHDCTIRLWDLAAGKSMCTLTHHKKSVRAVVFHPKLYMFASASPDNIKEWRCPDGKFVQNLSGHNAIVNCMAANEDGVLVSGADNGTVYFWDWKTGYNFQRGQGAVQPGSMDSEAGIFAMTFDQSGSRLITAEADKTVKIYKEDDTADEESHPVYWRPDIIHQRKY